MRAAGGGLWYIAMSNAVHWASQIEVPTMCRSITCLGS